ncbi:MAG TPA: hypothetical protein VIF57_20030 [Polyangia bacterium]
MHGRWRIGSSDARAWFATALLAAAAGCGGGADHPGSPQVTAGDGSSGGQPNDAGAAIVCGAPAPTTDACGAVATGALTACGQDADGQPSQDGYLEIQLPDGTKTYTCATAWSTAGYYFDHPEQFMSDPQSCCGGAATPVAAPTAPQPAIGYLGAPHAPHDLKPQETAAPNAGPIKQNPFAIVVRDPAGGAAVETALATWQTWAGDGQPHAAPDGSSYYMIEFAPINYTIVETSDGLPVVVVGPEVSPTANGKSPLGHPTLGVCPAGGGAPLVLMAGEIAGTVLSNHSGRYGHDTSVTQDALATAAKLFNCLGITVDSTTYYPPKP